MPLPRPYYIALAGLLVIALAIGMSVWTNRHDEMSSNIERLNPSPPPTPQDKKAVEDQATPSFDIVRINALGETVIAGRATPHAEVAILDGGKEIGRVIADNRGEWVFVPDQLLPPGSRELTLRASNPDGSTRETESPVILVVPDRAKDKSATLAVKINPDGSIDILQGPEAKNGAGSVSISAIRVSDKGALAATGKATPKARVQIYLDSNLLGGVKADDKGQWKISAKTALRSGNHTLRVDEIGANDHVVARAEITFTPTAAPGAAAPGEGKITVEPGASLWRIARGAYGNGVDYMTIFEANKAQIRNPDLIYPGQVLTVPASR